MRTGRCEFFCVSARYHLGGGSRDRCFTGAFEKEKCRRECADMLSHWRPLLTDVCTAGALGFVSDIICQLGPERRRAPQWPLVAPTEPKDEKAFDWQRLGARTLYDSMYIGGFLHYLYPCFPLVVNAAARLMPPKALDGRSVAQGFGCALVDNVHCGVLYIPTYFVCVGVLQGDSLQDAQATLRREWLEAYVGCTGFWIPFMSLNFTLVPPTVRVRAMAAANLVWNVYLDWLAHRGVTPTES